MIYRRRPSVVLLGIVTAFVLFAEALATIAYGRSWRVSWWEWHLLLVAAFFLVAYSAFVQWEREGSPTGLFAGLTMPATIATVRRSYNEALEALVAEIDAAHEAGTDRSDLPAVAFRLGKVFNLTERQVDVLLRAAEALACERDQLRRQGALVAVGREASVIRGEEELLEHVGRDELRIGLVVDEPATGHAPPVLIMRLATAMASSTEMAKPMLDALTLPLLAGTAVFMPMTRP